MEKTCSRCRRVLGAESFPANPRMRDGLDSQCRDCRRERSRESYYRAQGRPTPPKGSASRSRGRRVYGEDGRLAEKECLDCGRMLPTSAFGKYKRTGDGLGTYCRECHNERGRLSREANGGAREYHLRRRYGITSSEYDEKLAAQNGKCAACGDLPGVHVDHDHETGAVRGILCFTCNVALGNTGDDPGRLLALAAYLGRHGIPSPPTPVANSRRHDGARLAFRDEIAPGVWHLRRAS